MQIAGCTQVVDEVVRDAVSELFVAGRISEQADDHADDGIDGLSTERGQSVHQDDFSSQPGSFNGGGDSGNSRAADADVGFVLDHRRRAVAPDDPGFGAEGFIEHGDLF